jgi:integrase
MTTDRITKRTVDALPAAPHDQFLWDSQLKGFGLKQTGSGRRVYIVQYRMGGRGFPVRRYTIGPHGAWTPETARKEAERLLIKVAQGIDPATEKQRTRTLATELAFGTYADRFLNNEVKNNWKGRSYDFAESILRVHIKPAFAARPLPSLTRADMVRLFDGLPADQPAVRRNTYAVLQRLMRWAQARGDIPASPLDGFEKPSPVASRARVLADDELRCLLESSAKLNATFGAFVRLLIITGQRRNEVAGMTWKELSRGRREWLVPAERAKNGVENLLPLSDLAIAELDPLAGGEEWPKKGFVLSTNGAAPISGFSKIKTMLDAAMLTKVRDDDPEAEIDPWRLHDLRRTMATGMQRLRIPSEVIEACENRKAGHTRKGAAKVYQRHDFADEKREAMDRWAAFLGGLVADKENVIALPRAVA